MLNFWIIAQRAPERTHLACLCYLRWILTNFDEQFDWCTILTWNADMFQRLLHQRNSALASLTVALASWTDGLNFFRLTPDNFSKRYAQAAYRFNPCCQFQSAGPTSLSCLSAAVRMVQNCTLAEVWLCHSITISVLLAPVKNYIWMRLWPSRIHGLSHVSRGNINNPKYYVCKLLSAMEINVWPASHAIWDLVSQLDGAWHWLRALSPKIYFPWLSQLSGLHCQLCKAWGPARLSVETIKLPTRKYWPYESLLVQHSRAAFLEFEGAT